MNVCAGQSFFDGGKELGVGRLLPVPWIVLFIGFVWVISIPVLFSQAVLGHEYLLLCVLAQITSLESGSVAEARYENLTWWKSKRGADHIQSCTILFPRQKMKWKSLFSIFLKKSIKKRRKPSFLFIKEAASLAGKNFSSLPRNINNASRRDQRSHINHACMDIFYFKIIFLNRKNIHGLSYSGTVVFITDWTYISIYFFPQRPGFSNIFLFNIQNPCKV